MTKIPGPEAIKIHFAHSAYCLADRFHLRRPGIAHFQTWTADDTRERIAEGDVLVTSGFWSNDLLAEAERLKFIQICAVGHDQFDKAMISQRGIRLCNSAGVNANAVSDHALALLLGLTRHIHVARSDQSEKFWRPMISDLTKRQEELPGKTMLIYGVGLIGARIAKLAKAFDMHTIGIRRDITKTVENIDELHQPAAFLSLLQRADVVVLSCPLTDETRGLIDANAFDQMQDTAYLINVARGGCVVQSDLVTAIKERRIAGAGIDVTEAEPLPSDSPLWGCENVIITPHTGGETRTYEDSVVDNLIDNLERLWRGDTKLRHEIV